MSNALVREIFLAIGLVVLLLGSMFISTGTFPPMVVVESGSMMHDDEGQIGVIDPGDLVLVINPERKDVVTFVEATDPLNDNFGYESHGMEGDVIVFKKNGGTDTPVIHRALLKAIENESGGWDVPGTTLLGVQSINWTLEYACESYHGNDYDLRIENWVPAHEGYLTTGDNEDSNGCRIDQLSATGQDGRNGLLDENNNPVTAVKDEWIIGIASTEIPWIGAAKLFFSPPPSASYVTDRTWTMLGLVIASILIAPSVVEAFQTNKSTEEE